MLTVALPDMLWCGDIVHSLLLAAQVVWHALSLAREVLLAECCCVCVSGEVLLGDLSRAGFDITTDHEAADAIVVNTCAFVEVGAQQGGAAKQMLQPSTAHAGGGGGLVGACAIQQLLQPVFGGAGRFPLNNQQLFAAVMVCCVQDAKSESLEVRQPVCTAKQQQLQQQLSVASSVMCHSSINSRI
jgi:tRNA A37 methylthiotransferase MiaB